MLRRPPESSSRHHRPTKLSMMLCTFQRLTLFSLNCFSKSLIIDVDIYRPLPSLETWNGCAPHSALSCTNCYQLSARALSMQGTRICKIYYSPPPASPNFKSDLPRIQVVEVARLAQWIKTQTSSSLITLFVVSSAHLQIDCSSALILEGHGVRSGGALRRRNLNFVNKQFILDGFQMQHNCWHICPLSILNK